MTVTCVFFTVANEPTGSSRWRTNQPDGSFATVKTLLFWLLVAFVRGVLGIRSEFEMVPFAIIPLQESGYYTLRRLGKPVAGLEGCRRVVFLSMAAPRRSPVSRHACAVTAL